MNNIIIYIFTALFYLFGIPISQQSPTDTIGFNKVTSPLPNGILPLKQQIHLDISLKQQQMSATTVLTVSVTSPATTIVIHSTNVVSVLNVTQGGTMLQLVETVVAPNKDDFIQVELVNGEFQPGVEYTIAMRVGPYSFGSKEALVLQDATPSQLVVALEPRGARTLFPCMDEPNARIPFQIGILIRDPVEGLQALSNSALEFINFGSFGKYFQFKQTPSMATYLITFAVIINFQKICETVGPVLFQPNNEKMSNNHFGYIELCLHHKSLEKTEAQKALKLIRHYFDEYFTQNDANLPKPIYPFSKLDWVVVANFPHGAFEGWGLIHSNHDGVRKEKTIAHELAHQIFGNLVTLSGWDQIWLNEGFATFFANIFLASRTAGIQKAGWSAALKANFRENNFAPNTLTNVTLKRGLSSFAKEIWTMESNIFEREIVRNGSEFGGDQYDIGAYLLAMLATRIVGVEGFLGGITDYIETNQLSSASMDQIWESMEVFRTEFSEDLSVKEIMEPFLTQAGYPLIHVASGQHPWAISLHQSPSVTNSPATWNVPLVIWAWCETDEKVSKFLGKCYKVLQKNFNSKNKMTLDIAKNCDINPGCAGKLRILVNPGLEVINRVDYSGELSIDSWVNELQLSQDMRWKICHDYIYFHNIYLYWCYH